MPRAGEAAMSSEFEWLSAWFTARKPGEIKIDLFENIDSMGVISLICDIEKHFTIRFNERDFQNRNFSTVSGLAEIIRHKQNVL